jgi:folate-dependent phosphoribosylglycinamide formyltransferase PurN
MKKIVIITTPGAAKRDFANVLHTETNGAVALVIIQRDYPKPLHKRFLNFYRKAGFRGIASECLAYIACATNRKIRDTIALTKNRTPLTGLPTTYIPSVLEVADINSEEVRTRLLDIQPTVIAVWGGSIIRSHIIETTPIMFNMHAGFCPYYRGTHSNLHAIRKNDLKRIGTTIHTVVSLVDAGAIHRVITVNTDQPYASLFRELNDRSFWAYIDIVKRALQGDCGKGEAQDITLGQNYRLRDWTYVMERDVALMMIAHDSAYRTHEDIA